MITNGYTDLTTFKTWLGIGDTIDDALLERTVEAASRSIDAYTRRRFYADDAATAHYYRSPDGWRVFTHDFVAADGITLETDGDGDGTFETTWTTADYQLEPANGLTANSVVALSQPFPVYRSHRNAVKVTARWGIDDTPVAVVEATLILAARLFKRKDSPEGVIGFGDFGAVRLTPNDKDVQSLIEPYRKAVVV